MLADDQAHLLRALTKHGVETSFMTRYGRLEIVRRADGIGDYAAWLRAARNLKYEQMTIVVAGLLESN